MAVHLLVGARGRVIISGAGYNQRLTTIGGQPLRRHTHLAHTYEFFDTSRTTEDSCARVAATSVGSYAIAGPDHRVRRADDRRPQLRLALGDRHVSSPSSAARPPEARAEGWAPSTGRGCASTDPYRLQEIGGSGTSLTAVHDQRVRRDQLRYSWGLDGGGNVPHTHYRVPNRNSGKVMDLVGASTANNAEVKQYDLERRPQPEWAFEDARHRLPAHRQPEQRQVPRRGLGVHRRRREHHPVHLRQRHQPAVAVDRGRQLLPLKAARHSGKCLDVSALSTRRWRHRAVHLQYAAPTSSGRASRREPLDTRRGRSRPCAPGIPQAPTMNRRHETPVEPCDRLHDRRSSGPLSEPASRRRPG